MTSRETDLADRAERGRAADQALADDRRGRDKLVRRADEPPPSSHGDRSRKLPGVREDEPL
jgi:hypothetical protein